jgi:hypothetical protein
MAVVWGDKIEAALENAGVEFIDENGRPHCWELPFLQRRHCGWIRWRFDGAVGG